jgi:hypothetical protein
MSWATVVAARLRGLFQRNRLDLDLDAEIRFHLEMQIEDNQRAGMNPTEARYAALRRFGCVEPMKESYREKGLSPWWNRLCGTSATRCELSARVRASP